MLFFVFLSRAAAAQWGWEAWSLHSQPPVTVHANQQSPAPDCSCQHRSEASPPAPPGTLSRSAPPGTPCFCWQPLACSAWQADQLYKLCSVMGTPTQQTWGEGLKLAGNMSFRFPQVATTPLERLIPSASPAAVDLMTAMCQWDPARRPTALQALQHPFFQVNWLPTTAMSVVCHLLKAEGGLCAVQRSGRAVSSPFSMSTCCSEPCCPEQGHCKDRGKPRQRLTFM